jgi:pyrroline-5-carboxylate reductase
MLTDQTIALLGAGNMGRALLGGLLRSDGRGQGLDPARLRVTRRTQAALDALAAEFPGIHALRDNAGAVRGADLVVLAVKPQQALGVVEEVRAAVAPGTLVVSILAGVTTDALREALGQDLPVVRAMPNTPALVDEGATAIAAGRFAAPVHAARARAIFEAVGEVVELPEAMMDAVTGLSGSGPAYVYMIIEALTDGGVKQGLPRPQALRLAAQTVYGAARLVLETGKHPAILRDEVTTPGGTAIAAVADLESHGLRTMLINAVATAARRSAELSRLG